MKKPAPRQRHSVETFTLGLVLAGIGASAWWGAAQAALPLPGVLDILRMDAPEQALVGTVALGAGLLVLVRGPDLLADPRPIDRLLFGATLAAGIAAMAWFAFAA